MKVKDAIKELQKYDPESYMHQVGSSDPWILRVPDRESPFELGDIVIVKGLGVFIMITGPNPRGWVDNQIVQAVTLYSRNEGWIVGESRIWQVKLFDLTKSSMEEMINHIQNGNWPDEPESDKCESPDQSTRRF